MAVDTDVKPISHISAARRRRALLLGVLGLGLVALFHFPIRRS